MFINQESITYLQWSKEKFGVIHSCTIASAAPIFSCLNFHTFYLHPGSSKIYSLTNKNVQFSMIKQPLTVLWCCNTDGYLGTSWEDTVMEIVFTTLKQPSPSNLNTKSKNYIINITSPTGNTISRSIWYMKRKWCIQNLRKKKITSCSCFHSFWEGIFDNPRTGENTGWNTQR